MQQWPLPFDVDSHLPPPVNGRFDLSEKVKYVRYRCPRPKDIDCCVDHEEDGAEEEIDEEGPRLQLTDYDGSAEKQTETKGDNSKEINYGISQSIKFSSRQHSTLYNNIGKSLVLQKSLLIQPNTVLY